MSEKNGNGKSRRTVPPGEEAATLPPAEHLDPTGFNRAPGEAAPGMASLTPSEVEAVEEAAQREIDIVQQQAESGTRIRRVITTVDFTGGDRERVLDTLLQRPKGAMIVLGSLLGHVVSVERKINDYKGKQLASVWLHGAFEGIVNSTGEILSAPIAILPLAFAEMIENAFEGGAENVDFDINIGLIKTGRNIPYEWTVISYVEGAAQRALRDLKARRTARLSRAGQAKLLASPTDSVDTPMLTGTGSLAGTVAAGK